jgi:8-oxo-dGTP pyrophosphatase MutT (NUDIX family)
MRHIGDNPQVILKTARARLASAPPVLDARQGRPAAVLMALTDVEGAWHVIFTRRSGDLPDHAGEVSFPGGRLRAGEDALAAALREAEEEIGLKPELVEVIGFGDVCRTGSGHVIAPLLGLVRQKCVISPCPREVAEVFTAPLTHFLKAENYSREEMLVRGQRRQYWVVRWRQRRIWGATAAILWRLRERLS